MTDITRVGIDLAKKIFHVTAMDESGRGAGTQAFPARAVAIVPGAAAGGLRGGDGGVRQRASLGPAGGKPGPPGDADKPAQGGAVHAPEQERRERRGRDRRGFEPAGDAYGRAEAGGATAHAAVAPGAPAGGAGPGRRRRTSCMASLLEYGIESRKGIGTLLRRLPEVLEDAENELPPKGRALLRDLGEELRYLDGRVKRFEQEIQALAAADPACRRLQDIPGIGPLTATALAAAVGDAGSFRNGRELSAWLGLVPRQHSTGGRTKLMGISKRGDSYVRCLLIHGARGGRCNGRGGARTGAANGPRRSKDGAAATSRRWRWRTRTRAPPGRCWRAGRRSTAITWARPREGWRRDVSSILLIRENGFQTGGSNRPRLRSVK